MSARAYDSIPGVKTTAVLAGTDNLLPEHIAEAIPYTNLDGQLHLEA